MSNFGYSAQTSNFNRVGDDFTVPQGQTWTINSIYFYCYQTNAPTNTSPITAITLRIWNDQSGAPGSTLIYGDTTTNRLTRSKWANGYRVLESATGTSSTRAIFRNTVTTPQLVLTAGTYWLDWNYTGSSSYSGPWANPIVIAGNPITGNAVQQLGGAQNPWTAVTDPGSQTEQGLPFSIFGVSTVGIDQPENLKSVNVYPNPASNMLQINLELNNPDQVIIEVYNVLGEKVFVNSSENRLAVNQSIDVAAWSAGAYFVRISIGNESMTRKVIVE
ncbi:MAG: hypothetical protein Fur0041_16500 [Bacteroidia bacterium]